MRKLKWNFQVPRIIDKKFNVKFNLTQNIAAIILGNLPINSMTNQFYPKLINIVPHIHIFYLRELVD
jgi:hypothetical protein